MPVEQLAFDFGDIEVMPEWAAGCVYCHRDDLGLYDEAVHFGAHLPLTCDVCGETAPNRLLFDMSHRVNLGASWESGWLLCTSLSLRLNHLTNAVKTGTVPDERDLTAVALGWRIGPDGAQLAPAGWRSSEAAVECVALERAA